MIAIPVQVLVCVCWFSVDCSCEGVVGLQGDQGVQERKCALLCWLFYCELDVWILVVDVL